MYGGGYGGGYGVGYGGGSGGSGGGGSERDRQLTSWNILFHSVGVDI